MRAVFESSIPTISAVGHETDVTLSDFAADLRAPTPSAAAELAVPDINEILASLSGTAEYLRIRINDIIERYASSVEVLSGKIRIKNPIYAISANEQMLSAKSSEINEKFRTFIHTKEHMLSEKAAVISALNPLSVLMRGYAIAYKNTKVITSADEVSVGDEIRIKLNDGEIIAEVRQTEE